MSKRENCLKEEKGKRRRTVRNEKEEKVEGEENEARGKRPRRGGREGCISSRARELDWMVDEEPLSCYVEQKEGVACLEGRRIERGKKGGKKVTWRKREAMVKK